MCPVSQAHGAAPAGPRIVVADLRMTLPITTPRLRLRPHRSQDVARIHDVLYGDPAVRAA